MNSMHPYDNITQAQLFLFQQYKDVSTRAQLDEIYERNLKDLVARINELLNPYDAFDLIELMRTRELLPIPDPRATRPDGSAVHIEIIAAILLSRQSRAAVNDSGGSPDSVIEEAHSLAYELSQHSVFRAMTLAEIVDDEAARSLALYQTSKAIISNFQFDEIRDAHDSALLDHETTAPMFNEVLGYSSDDVKRMRNAIDSIQADRLTKARDASGDGVHDLIQKYGDVTGGNEDENRVIEDALDAMLFHPSRRSVMSVPELAETSQLSAEVVERIISDYCQHFEQSIAAQDRVHDLLKGDWQFSHKPLVRDTNGDFVLVANGLGDDTLRRSFEDKLKGNQKRLQRYDQKVRAPVTEDLASTYIRQLLKPKRSYQNLKYAFSDKVQESSTGLDASLKFDQSRLEFAEGDGLFIKDDIAVVVEVKGKSVSEKARTGHLRRFARDVQDTVHSAKIQASRLSSLIRESDGVWTDRGHWLDLSDVTRIFNVVVLLDDVGPIGTQTQEVDGVDPAWVVSLHDLAVISVILKRPTDFLSYLQFRTTMSLGYDVVAVDELDIFSQFLNGQIFTYSELKQVFQRIPVVEATNSDIDAWMHRKEVEKIERRKNSVGRPRILIGPRTRDLIMEIERSGQTRRMSASVDVTLAAIRNPQDFEQWLMSVSSRGVSKGDGVRVHLFAAGGGKYLKLTKFDVQLSILELLKQMQPNNSPGEDILLSLFLSPKNRLVFFRRP